MDKKLDERVWGKLASTKQTLSNKTIRQRRKSIWVLEKCLDCLNFLLAIMGLGLGPYNKWKSNATA